MMLNRKKFLELTSKYSITTLLLQHTSLNALAMNSLKSHLPSHISATCSAPPTFNLLDSIADYLVLENHEEGNLLIIAHELHIDADLTLPGDRTVSIFAYKTTLDRSVTLPGKNFFLFTESLTCTDNPTIDTSGLPGHDFVQDSKPGLTGCNLDRKSPKAPNADNVGVDNIQLDDPNKNGSLNGTTAGNVWLNAKVVAGRMNVKAVGGNGGHGENGKAGLDGCFQVSGRHPDNNSDGYPGMSGGDGALGGYGGAGGQVTLVYDGRQTIQSSFSGGQQGASGEGGKGGVGGVRTTIYKNGEPVELPEDRFPTKGPKGKPGLTPDNTGIRSGKAGSLSTSPINETYYKYVPLEFGKLLLLKADSLYLNGHDPKNMAAAEELYRFIVDMAKGNAGFGYNDNTSAGEIKSYLASYLSVYHTDADGWRSLSKKALSLLNQMNLGLGIFGNPLNYAPNLEPDYLLTQYNKIIGFIDGFEAFAITLLSQQKNIEITQENNQLCIQQYNSEIDQFKQNIEDLAALVISLNKEINKRFLMLQVMKDNLMKDDEDFQDAVRAESGGCSLGDALRCVVAIVEIVGAIYTAGASAALAAKGIADVVQGLEASNTLELFKVALSDQGIIREGINDLSKSAATAKASEAKIKEGYKVLATDTHPAPPSLIGVNKEKFDETIEKYLNLPAAQKYKADYHNFVDYAEQTNQKRRELTGSILAISTAWHNLTIVTAQKNNLENTNVALLKDKISISTKTAVTDLYYKSKESLIKMIYLQRSAIKYQDPSGDYLDKNYDDYNITMLKTQLFAQNFALIDSLNRRNFYRRFNTIPYSILPADQKPALSDRKVPFKNFSTSTTDDTGTKIYTLEFKISTWPLNANSSAELKARINYLNSIFQNAKNIKVMGLQVALRSSEDLNKNLNFSIRHLGNSTVTTAANFQQPKTFRHLWKEAKLTAAVSKKPRVTSFTEDQKTNLVGKSYGNSENCYLGVSPFASWKLQIKENENPHLTSADIEHMISRLSSIDLYFWHYFENV